MLLGNQTAEQLGLVSTSTAANLQTNKLDKTFAVDPTVNPNGFVLLWMQMLDAANSVNIAYGAVQPTTGVYSQGVVNIPLGDPSKAGLITKEQAAAIESFGTRLSNLEAGAVGNTFIDTYAALLAIDTTQPEWINNRPVIVRADENHDGQYSDGKRHCEQCYEYERERMDLPVEYRKEK